MSTNYIPASNHNGGGLHNQFALLLQSYCPMHMFGLSLKAYSPESASFPLPFNLKHLANIVFNDTLWDYADQEAGNKAGISGNLSIHIYAWYSKP